MYIPYNANPDNIRVGDCTVRAISEFMNQSWDDTYWGLALQGAIMHDMPSGNNVWGAYLFEHGYKSGSIPNTCPDCYTVADFCKDHPQGTYLVATGTHAICVIDGDHFDTWDSSNEPVFYYFYGG